MHDRAVVNISADIQQSTDQLMKFVHEHETRGLGFIYKAATKALRKLGIEDDTIYTVNKLHRKNKLINALQHGLINSHTEKNLHSVFYKNIQRLNLSRELTFQFLNSTSLTSETEGFITACQDGVINTLIYRSEVLGIDCNTACRKCNLHPETLMHLLAACPGYAPNLYINRHDSALRTLYSHLARVCDLPAPTDILFSNANVPTVVENEQFKLMWNFPFRTIQQISANKPDITFHNLVNKTIYLIEFSSPSENNILAKESEKIDKYKPLIYNLRLTYPEYTLVFIPIIIGVLGGMAPSVLDQLKKLNLKDINPKNILKQMQQNIIHGSLTILRRHQSSVT